MMLRLKRMVAPVVCLLVLAGGAPAALAAAPASGTAASDLPTQVTAMRALHFMVGTWAGSGWNLSPTGEKQEFTQTERVAYKAGGQVITVEGEGHDKADRRRVVDTALAVIGYNDTTGRYRWEAFSQGYVTEAVPVVGDHLFQWSIATPATTIRYTLRFTRRTWHEIGEVTLDGGQTWRQTFQMDLRRVR